MTMTLRRPQSWRPGSHHQPLYSFAVTLRPKFHVSVGSSCCSDKRRRNETNTRPGRSQFSRTITQRQCHRAIELARYRAIRLAACRHYQLENISNIFLCILTSGRSVAVVLVPLDITLSKEHNHATRPVACSSLAVFEKIKASYIQEERSKGISSAYGTDRTAPTTVSTRVCSFFC
jgi:hypothetical protein